MRIDIPDFNYSVFQPEVDTLIKQYKDYLKAMIAEKMALSNFNFPEVEQSRALQSQIGDAMFYNNPYIWIMYKIKAYSEDVSEIIGIDSIRAKLTNPITTWSDLIEHSCKTPGYICGNRFHFLMVNLLAKKGYVDQSENLKNHSPKEMHKVDRNLFNFMFQDQMQLQDLFADPDFISLIQDPEFIDLWNTYEHATIEVPIDLMRIPLERLDELGDKKTESKVNKWGNYGLNHEL